MVVITKNRIWPCKISKDYLTLFLQIMQDANEFMVFQVWMYRAGRNVNACTCTRTRTLKKLWNNLQRAESNAWRVSKSLWSAEADMSLTTFWGPGDEPGLGLSSLSPSVRLLRLLLLLLMMRQGAGGGGWQSRLNADRISVGGHGCVIGD